MTIIPPGGIYRGEIMSDKKCPHCRTKDRSDEEIKALISRLNRIEGQIRGIRKTVEYDAYCVDILTQVNAAKCSLNSFSEIKQSGCALSKKHHNLRMCILNGKQQK